MNSDPRHEGAGKGYAESTLQTSGIDPGTFQPGSRTLHYPPTYSDRVQQHHHLSAHASLTALAPWQPNGNKGPLLPADAPESESVFLITL